MREGATGRLSIEAWDSVRGTAHRPCTDFDAALPAAPCPAFRPGVYIAQLSSSASAPSSLRLSCGRPASRNPVRQVRCALPVSMYAQPQAEDSPTGRPSLGTPVHTRLGPKWLAAAIHGATRLGCDTGGSALTMFSPGPLDPGRSLARVAVTAIGPSTALRRSRGKRGLAIDGVGGSSECPQ